MRYLFSIGLLAGFVYAQPGIIFSVSGVTPLAQAAEAFETRYGISVSYEDANYAYEGDLIDETHPDYAKAHPNGSRALTPKGGSLTLHGDPKFAVHSAQEAMPLLQALVNDHKKAGIPGEFKLIPNGDGVAIVPTAVKDASGILLPDQSLLETKITLPELKRTGDETLNAICEAVKTNSGKHIGVATNQFMSLYYTVTIGALNEPARSVLQRTLAGLEFTGGPTHIPKASWSLFYDPGLKMYLLNVRQVRMEVPTPAGGKIKRPVFR
jgi:hypothetical protein